MLSNDRSNPVFDRVPERYRRARLDELPQAIVAKLDPVRSTFFFGATGRGKTYALAALCNLDGGKRWIDWPELLDDAEIASKMRPDDRIRFDPFRWAERQEGMIYVDDVGAETDKDGPARFAWLVNARYNADRGLSFTTNLDPDKLQAYCGQRTMSRLVEMATAITLVGDDRRLTPTPRPVRLPLGESNVTHIGAASATKGRD